MTIVFHLIWIRIVRKSEQTGRTIDLQRQILLLMLLLLLLLLFTATGF